MRRTRMGLAVAVALVIIGGPAIAGGEIAPSGFKPGIGSVNSDSPVAEMGSDDDDFLVIDSQRKDGLERVSFVATFTGVPSAPGTFSFRYRGRTSTGICDAPVKLWHWKKRRYVSGGIALGIGNTESQFPPLPGDPSYDRAKFVKDGQARIKMTCHNAEDFVLETDLLLIVS